MNIWIVGLMASKNLIILIYPEPSDPWAGSDRVSSGGVEPNVPA